MGFKLAVNTRLLQKGKLEGIGRFTYENLIRMVKNNPEVEFHFIFDRPFDPDFIFADNVKAHVIGPPTRHEVLQYIWFHLRLPKLLKKLKVDAFFSPEGYNIPLGKIPSFITQHDIGWLHRPSDVPSKTFKFYNKHFPKYSLNASKVFTVSAYSKKDLITEFRLDDKDVVVCYNGHEHLEINRSIKRLNRPYFLYVGSLHPRKNILHTLKSFELFRSKYKLDFELIIVGKRMFADEETEAFFSTMKFQSDVVFTDYVPDAELSTYFANATALINLSYFEGFGIPIVEAFKNGVPCILSNSTCFPEIAGDAALYSEPEDIELIASHMNDIANNETLSNRLINSGFSQIEKFSWEKSAQTIMNTILENGTKKL